MFARYRAGCMNWFEIRGSVAGPNSPTLMPVLGSLTRCSLRSWSIVLMALVFLTVVRLRGQELTVLGGGMTPSQLRDSSYTYQVDYRQDLYRNFAASMTYINEGHPANHHRDGTAWQAWGNLPLFDERISLSLGAGAYYYYDTQPDGAGGSLNVHGTAPIFSATVTGYLSNRWFYRVAASRINPSRDFKTQTLAVGVGYWLGPNRRPLGSKPGENPVMDDYVTPTQVTLLGGQSIVNTFFSESAWAGAGELRRGFAPHLDWTASAIYEGDPKIVRRSGVALQVWPVNTFLERKITVGFGLGPYIYIDKKHPVGITNKSPAAIAPLVSLSLTRDLGAGWFARFLFNRVTSNYQRDADMMLVGLGYKFGE